MYRTFKSKIIYTLMKNINYLITVVDRLFVKNEQSKSINNRV